MSERIKYKKNEMYRPPCRAARLFALICSLVLVSHPSMLRAQDPDSSSDDDQLYQINDQFYRYDDSSSTPMYESDVHFDTTSPAWQWQNPFPIGVHLFAMDVLFADSMCSVGQLGAF